MGGQIDNLPKESSSSVKAEIQKESEKHNPSVTAAELVEMLK